MTEIVSKLGLIVLVKVSKSGLEVSGECLSQTY